MGTLELLLLSLGVAMDAFAASVCKGLAVKRVSLGRMLACGLWFGAFQALMPLLGYLLGVRFQSVIVRFDHWIAFVLLGCIGVNMLREALGVSRKRAIIILEHLDAVRFTVLDKEAGGLRSLR